MPRGVRLSALLAVVLTAGAHAASVEITPQQAEMLMRLPAAQRELLRKALTEEAQQAATPTRAAEPAPEEPSRRQGTPEPKLEGETDGGPRLRAGDTVLIHFEPIEQREEREPRAAPRRLPPPPEQAAAERERARSEEALRAARLPEHPVFTLDHAGAVTLANVGRFVLAGLNETEAAERIAAEPALRGVRVRVKRLPIEPELERFGHDLFADPERTFAPAADIPVPADYVIGPGDTVIVQLVGKENVEHELTVTRDGTLLFPGIGPIGVAGMEFAELEKELKRRVARQFIGAQASVTLGRLRSIRVFVLGEVARPGSYTVSSLATLTNALLASGGITPVGTLRDVQLKRKGNVVARLDLYDLLLRGDTSGDARLLPGDVIFVPPVGRVVGVGGRVRRPALYELKNEQSAAEVIAMAAGLMPDADPRSARLERLEGDARVVIDLDLTAGGGEVAMRDGDILRVYPIPEERRRAVRLSGRVLRPGEHEWRPGMRLTDLIRSLDVLAPEADARYALLVRERPDDRQLVLRGVDPRAALAAPGGPEDVELEPRDEVRVFGVHDDRAALIQPLLERAQRSSSPEEPRREVSIGGSVHHPGRYPWFPGMTVADLLDAGGGLTERAYRFEAELTRFVVDGGARQQRRELIRLDPGAGGEGLRRTLAPHDRLVVRRVPHWDEEGMVEILGEVRFPGRYPIARGERLSQVIERAGGFTRAAYPRAAIFLRESLRQREQEHLEQLIAQLEQDLALVGAEGPEIGVRKDSALREGEVLLRQMRAARATGRMVVDLAAVMNPEDDYDVTMQDGDRLIIPQRPDEVTVLGEVYHPTSHVYVPGRTVDDYVALSGGATERAHRRATFVVHADGSVTPPRGWFADAASVGPGDTVIVPVKIDRVSNLKLFTDISTILFQLSVTAAALDSIGVF
ncbi:MAG TPA: SLBB domain-containing protein [Burkholderiales bacterium]